MTPLPARHWTLLIAFAALAMAACETPMKKKEEEIAKSTFACSYNGERFVVRFAEGEARMLLDGVQRVTLYQFRQHPECATATARWNCAAKAPNCN